MRLLCATQFYPPSVGGMQLSNRLLVEGLASAGAMVDLHVFAGEHRETEQQGNIRRYDHPIKPKSIMEHFACANTLIRLAKVLRPDFVLLLDEGIVRALGFLPLPQKNGLRYVSINSGSTLTRDSRHFRGLVNSGLVRRGYRWLDLLFVAQSTAATLPGVCPEVADRVRMLGRPVPDSFFTETGDEGGVPAFGNDLPTLFSCARAEEEKGIRLVLLALARLRDQRGAEVANFVFAGDGPALTSWRRLAQELSLRQIRFVGRLPLEDLIPYYRSCYMCIFPAHGVIETFGRTWMEAFACGKPAISTTTDNLKYLVSDSANSIVIEPKVDSICTGIRRALNLNPAEYWKMSQRAREMAQPYSQNAIVENLLRNLEDLK